jgi:hypothetical protein
MRASLLVLAVCLLAGCSPRSNESAPAATEESPHSFRPPCCPDDTLLAGVGADGSSHRLTRGTMTVSGAWTACGYAAADLEGVSVTLLCGDGSRTVLVRGATPVAWDPAGSRLLLREAVADDDLRHFVLDVARGEFEKRGDRMQWILGERGDRFSGWRGDTVWFRNAFAPDRPPHAAVIPAAAGAL